MTIVGLQRALVERVRADLARLWRLETAHGGARAPRVAAGWLPPKRSRPEDEDEGDLDRGDFPFVLVRPVSGDDGDERAVAGEATVHLVIGTYSEDDEGHTDVLLVIDLLRQSLQERPVLTAPGTGSGRRDPHDAVVGHAELRLPLTWTLLPEHPQPYWGGYLTTTWTVPRPERVDVEEMTR